MDKSLEIQTAKEAFNRFFREDLYGRFDSDENLILSRGSWNDNVVRLPKFFKFCLDLSLQKHWIGYSNSLGHSQTFRTLIEWVNVGQIAAYSSENCALTMGNIATIGLVFDQLKEWFPKGKVLTLEPYYPSILKAVSRHFSVATVSSLQSEEDLERMIRDICTKDRDYKILLLSNLIGVEGRIFSRKFWERISQVCNDLDLYLVIDEGLWFERLDYPPDMNNERTIRLVSTSKKYGNPGMKIGYMLAPEKFIYEYYDRASTYLGGPPSLLFLLAEFLYKFEYVQSTQDTDSLRDLSEWYSIDQEVIEKLYKDACRTNLKNQNLYSTNRKWLISWLSKNRDIVEQAYIFEGVNILFRPNINTSSYDFFLSLIQKKNVSVFPGICLGEMSDQLCRITILESPKQMQEGLKRISDFLREK